MSVEIIRQQEALLQFDTFTNDTAIEIGLMMLEESRAKNQSIAVDISRCGQQVFHAALPGTSPDIDCWLMKKRNTVNRFFCSSLAMQLRMKAHGVFLVDAFKLDPTQFVESGGGFPILVKGVGFIGAIVASGTSDVQEHELIVSCISRYLNITDCPRLL